MSEFAIHDAVKEDDLEKVRQLIEAGVPVDSLNRGGQTPLHRAAFYGRYEVARQLINSKCDFNIKDRHGLTPVMLAARRRKKDNVEMLLHNVFKEITQFDNDGFTLLHYAAEKGWTSIVRLILDNGEADLNAVDRDGSTPLMWSTRASFKEEEIAALLIRAGADVNRSDFRKRTVLHWAVKYGPTSVIQLLLEKEGLHLNPQDVHGDTPLHLACRTTERDARKQLLDAGADTNVKNNDGLTALSEGIKRGTLTHKEIGLFVKNGAFLENFDYECISQNPFLKENVLKDVELCTQSVVNKFNRQSLPALNSIAYFARKLPNVDNFKLGARHIDEVENLVKCEIERNTFCNLIKVRPIALSAFCVLSLITCQSGKKRAA